MFEARQASGLGAQPWRRTEHRARVCSPCWSSGWGWLVSCCLFSLLNLFLSVAEGIKDAIWDCLFRYSMVLTSFLLSYSFLFIAGCRSSATHVQIQLLPRICSSSWTLEARETGRHKLWEGRGKTRKSGNEWALVSAAPRAASRSSYLEQWKKMDVMLLTSFLGVTGGCVYFGICRLIKIKHFFTLLRDSWFMGLCSIQSQVYRVKQDWKSCLATSLLTLHTVPVPPGFNKLDLLSLSSSKNVDCNNCVHNCSMFQVVILGKSGKPSPGRQRRSTWYQRSATLPQNGMKPMQHFAFQCSCGIRMKYFSWSSGLPCLYSISGGMTRDTSWAWEVIVAPLCFRFPIYYKAIDNITDLTILVC